MKLRITKTNIKEGKPGDTTCCPVALALKDRGFVNPFVDHKLIDPDMSDISMPAFFPPRKLKRWIKKFDKDCKVRPITVKIKGLRTNNGS